MLRTLMIPVAALALGCPEPASEPASETTHTREVIVIDEAEPAPAPKPESGDEVGFELSADEEGASVEVKSKTGSASIEVEKEEKK